MIGERKAKIIGIDKLGSSKLFKLLPEEKLEFKAGQFIRMSKLDRSIGRPYSIASPPSWDFLEFLIKIGGEFTDYLDGLKVGDEVLISKAAGHLTYSGEGKAVFVAGGTGIAPIMGIIRDLAINKVKGEFYLFYSSRKFSEMAFYEELRVLDETGVIKFIPIITREEISWAENKRIDLDMIKKYCGDLNASYFMCGNSKMVNSIKDGLIKEGVDKTKIKIEGWG